MAILFQLKKQDLISNHILVGELNLNQNFADLHHDKKQSCKLLSPSKTFFQGQNNFSWPIICIGLAFNCKSVLYLRSGANSKENI